jgi:thiol-disulfide isomerase/thioredoxin
LQVHFQFGTRNLTIESEVISERTLLENYGISWYLVSNAEISQLIQRKSFVSRNGGLKVWLVRLHYLCLDLFNVENTFVHKLYTMKITKGVLGNAIVIGALGVFCAGAADSTIEQMSSKMPPLAGATGWLNSPPLTANGLRGKVVLVDFWTYSCINWRRTLPYISAWAAKYKNQGLVVIGVHTPEFSFEHYAGNVNNAVREMKIDYPIAIDDNYAIWNAFRNEYWPASYFIDAQGHIRQHQFGEGSYQESEKIIQQLLTEAGAKAVPGGFVSVHADGSEAAADWASLQSSENYVGYSRTGNFASPGGAAADRNMVYNVPSRLTLNQWALSGDWTMGAEATVLNKPNGKMLYCFHARDLQLVMGPSTTGTPVRFRVLIDGQVPGAAHGVDVDSQGNGLVTEPRMYQLIRQQGVIVDRLFEIEFLDPGVTTFSYTFG